VAQYERALCDAPGYVNARRKLAGFFLAHGRRDDAERTLSDGLEACPGEPLLLSDLGTLLIDTGRFEDGLAHLESAATASPRDVAMLAALAWGYLWSGAPERAAAVFRDALTLDPKHASCRHGLGLASLFLGAFDDAREALERAIDADPCLADAYHRLARAGWLDPASSAFERLASLLAHEEKLDQDRRSKLHFAAAAALDRAGDCDRAFQHYRTANALKDVVYDPDATARYVDTLIETYDPAHFRRVAGWGRPDETPVLVVGLPRSGTSVVEQILASHPDVAGAGELEALNRIANGLAQWAGPDTGLPAAVEFLAPETVGTLANDYLVALRRHAPDAGRIVDKMPRNILHLGLFATLFPRGRVIRCRRDPMDTCLSMYCADFRGNYPCAYDLSNLAHYNGQMERLMDHWHAVLPIPVTDVAYETLVEDQTGETRRMLAFCGLEWTERCLAFHETERPVQTMSCDQVRKPIYRSAVGRWRRYGSQLEPLRVALAVSP